jgi:hypothetical protein
MDVKVLLSDVPLTRAFAAARRYFIFVPPGRSGRTEALKSALDHLRCGGSLLIFPHGDVEPDVEVGGNALPSLRDWSRSVEIMLRRVPESWLQLAIISGVLARRFLRSPVVRLRKNPARQQKLAEVLQLSWQLIFPQSVHTQAHVSFSKALMGSSLVKEGVMPGLIGNARRLLQDHLESWGIPAPPEAPPA